MLPVHKTTPAPLKRFFLGLIAPLFVAMGTGHNRPHRYPQESLNRTTMFHHCPFPTQNFNFKFLSHLNILALQNLSSLAKQVGNAKVIGTADNLTGYNSMYGYILRKKSSLTGKKFWKHKSFEGSRRSCSRFGEGNIMASIAYKNAPAENKEYPLFLQLKNIAIINLKLNIEKARIEEWLKTHADAYRKKPLALKATTKKPRPRMRHACRQTKDYVCFKMKTLKRIMAVYGNDQLKLMVQQALQPPKQRKAREFPPGELIVLSRPVHNLSILQQA